MARKKRTPAEDSEENNLSRDKRKWQIALRRYLIESKPSTFYAPYFGLSVDLFRAWIEIQFTNGINWENFGAEWQFEHLVPAQYFDLNNDEDLRLYWNFLNIRVELIKTTSQNKLDILGAKAHFDTVFFKTGLETSKKMSEKLQLIAQNEIAPPEILTFLNNNLSKIKNITTLDGELLLRLNQGEKLEDLILEMEILSKFGS